MGRTDEVYLVSHFHEAIESGSIQAYFQPIYRTYTGKILCAESLSRWFLPDGKMLAPDDFIPVLERNGLIYELDMEILRQSCALYRELSNRGTALHSFSVNLSRHDFLHEDLFETVIKTLERYKVPHEAIKIEITESLMLEDIESFEAAFRKFVNAHFSVWLDDFGSGYSSLNMLQSYRFDVIKFDMLFLRDLSVRGKQLLASLVNMSKSMGFHTLVEGVEKAEQKEFLMGIGCEAMQGFYLSKPISKEDLIHLLTLQPGCAETREDIYYWNKIGRLNFMSPNPLKDFTEAKDNGAEADQEFSIFDNSLALLECSQTQFNYVYATNGYLHRIRELGFDSLSGLEGALSNQHSHQYMLIRNIILDAITRGTVQTVEYVNKDVYFRLSVQLLSRKTGWVMMGMRLSTFDSEREVKTAREMLNYGSALFSTYELAVMIYPDRNIATRIYTSNNLPVYDREDTIRGSVEKFCEAEVEPVDQKRYLRFLDFSSMGERIESSPKMFIQSFFRMRWGEGSGNWYTARITQIPKSAERTYLLTFQSIPGNVNQMIEVMYKEHPELLESVNL